MSVPRKLSVMFATAFVTLMAWTGSASAQVIVDPVVVSERNDGGWVYWIAIALGALGLVLVIFLTIQYMRYAPRFSKDEEGLRVVRADRVHVGRELPRRNVDLSQAAPLVVAPPAVPAAAPALAPAAAAAPAAVPTPAAAEATPAPAPAAPAPAVAEAPASAPPRQRPRLPRPPRPPFPRSGPRSRWTRRRTRRP